MALIRFLFWTAVFLASALAFTVLFEHGPTHFAANARTEIDSVKEMFGVKLERKKDESDKLTPRIGTEKAP